MSQRPMDMAGQVIRHCYPSGNQSVDTDSSCVQPGVAGYTWNKKLFPDPKDFLKQLHDRNVKATLNLHPADGVRHFEDAYTDMCKALGKDPKDKVPIPFEPENREFMDAYFDILHRRLENDGVDFWVSWLDSLRVTQC